jgi:hypothetical protein
MGGVAVPLLVESGRGWAMLNHVLTQPVSEWSLDLERGAVQGVMLHPKTLWSGGWSMHPSAPWSVGWLMHAKILQSVGRSSSFPVLRRHVVRAHLAKAGACNVPSTPGPIRT